MREVKLVIIGGGPAGLAAALGAHKSGLESILILEREAELGGILRQCIHNGFGLHTFHEELTGPEYAARYVDEVNRAGIPYHVNTTVISLSADKTITCVSPEFGLEQIHTEAVILAMGCRERPRGALGTAGTRPSGIYTAGTAQKFVNLHGLMPGKHVVILGSGDIGLIMARRMTFMGAKVEACVELMPYSSGLKRNIVQCLDDFQIPLLLSHTVTEIHGRDRLTGVTIAKVDAQNRPIAGTEREIACDTLLLSVGLLPENELSMMAGIEMAPSTSGPVVNNHYETSVPGIFSCGNVLHVHDLVDYVSKEAECAGIHAARQVLGQMPPSCGSIAVKAGNGIGGYVPQKILSPCSETVTIMFRPRAVFRDATILVKTGELTLLEKKQRILTPGEMVTLLIPGNAMADVSIGQDLVIEVKES